MSDTDRESTALGPPSRCVEIVVSFRTLVFILAVLAVAWALASIADALLVLFIAFFLALVLDPVVRGLERRTRAPRGVAATVVVLSIALVIGVLIATLAVPLIQAVHDLIVDLPNIVSSLRRSDLFRSIDRRVDIGAELQRRASDLAGNVPSAAVDLIGLGGAVAAALFRAFGAAFLTLYLLIDMPRLERALHSVLRPETSARIASLREEITSTLSRYAVGAVIIAVVAGTVEGTTAWLLGAPLPLALAVSQACSTSCRKSVPPSPASCSCS